VHDEQHVQIPDTSSRPLALPSYALDKLANWSIPPHTCQSKLGSAYLAEKQTHTTKPKSALTLRSTTPSSLHPCSPTRELTPAPPSSAGQTRPAPHPPQTRPGRPRTGQRPARRTSCSRPALGSGSRARQRSPRRRRTWPGRARPARPGAGAARSTRAWPGARRTRRRQCLRSASGAGQSCTRRKDQQVSEWTAAKSRRHRSSPGLTSQPRSGRPPSRPPGASRSRRVVSRPSGALARPPS